MTLRIKSSNVANTDLILRSLRSKRLEGWATQGLAAILRDAAKRPLLRMRLLEFRVVDRLVSIERSRDRRQRILKPCRAIEQHHAIIFRDASVREALLVGGIGR